MWSFFTKNVPGKNQIRLKNKHLFRFFRNLLQEKLSQIVPNSTNSGPRKCIQYFEHYENKQKLIAFMYYYNKTIIML